MPKAASSDPYFGGPLTPGLRVCGARYLLRRLIGRGEFSELWLARNIQNAGDVALKFLPKAFLQDKNLLDFLQEEVRRQTLLKHPHIVLVHELAHDYDSTAIAMEFVDGWSLATLKVDKPERRHNVSEIGPWIGQLCDALAFAHNEFGMVHGDLKPSNLLVSPRDGIKVSDFGLAAHIRNESSKRGIVKSGYAGIGYLSPQQVMGETPGKADDIYSLGAALFDLLTGTPPFYKGEVIAQIRSLKPPRMAQRLAELGVQGEPVPVVWEETVAVCLAKNPADRPQTAEEVRRLLDRPEPEAKDLIEPPKLPVAPGQSGGNPDAAAVTTTPRKAARPWTPFVAAIVAAFVAVGLIGALWFIRSGKFAAILATG
ncbi:MAG: serine/threonine-protein kinase, partial [Limisphaerales bacterium]